MPYSANWRVIVSNVVALWVMLGALLGAAQFLPAVGSSTLRSALIGTLVALGSVFVLYVVVPRFDRNTSRSDYGIAVDLLSPVRFAAGLGIGFAMIGLQIANVLSFGGDVTIVEGRQLGANTILLALASYLAWAAVEELGFRSYALFRLRDAFGTWPAQLMVALVFGAYHFAAGHPWEMAFLGTTVGSLAYGYAALASRGVGLPIGLHAAWNIGEWLASGKGESRPGPWQLDIADTSLLNTQIAGGIGFYVIHGTVILGCIVYLKRRKPA